MAQTGGTELFLWACQLWRRFWGRSFSVSFSSRIYVSIFRISISSINPIYAAPSAEVPHPQMPLDKRPSSMHQQKKYIIFIRYGTTQETGYGSPSGTPSPTSRNDWHDRPQLSHALTRAGIRTQGLGRHLSITLLSPLSTSLMPVPPFSPKALCLPC